MKKDIRVLRPRRGIPYSRSASTIYDRIKRVNRKNKQMKEKGEKNNA